MRLRSLKVNITSINKKNVLIINKIIFLVYAFVKVSIIQIIGMS